MYERLHISGPVIYITNKNEVSPLYPVSPSLNPNHSFRNVHRLQSVYK